jgi:hypothetical protein
MEVTTSTGFNDIVVSMSPKHQCIYKGDAARSADGKSRIEISGFGMAVFV